MSQQKLKVVNGSKLVPFAGDAPIVFGGFKIFNVNVTFEDFVAGFRENSNQRATELRSTKHLLPVCPEHLEVACMVTMKGEKILLNGHTRRLFWMTNRQIAPQMVRMTVFEIIDPALNAVEEEYRLYSSYDSRKAVKTSAHTVQGAMRKDGIEFDTPWLRAGRFAEALRAAAAFCGVSTEQGKIDIIRLIREFDAELSAFDKISPAKGRWPTALMAAGIIMLRKAPAVSVERVLNSYNLNSGSRSESGSYNPLGLMDELHRDGIASGKTRFPTDTGNVDLGITKMARLIHLALVTPDSLFKKNSNAVMPFTREELKKLVVPAEVVAKTI